MHKTNQNEFVREATERCKQSFQTDGHTDTTLLHFVVQEIIRTEIDYYYYYYCYDSGIH